MIAINIFDWSSNNSDFNFLLLLYNNKNKIEDYYLYNNTSQKMPNAIINNNMEIIKDNEKKCPSCNKIKLKIEFNKNGQYLMPICSICRNTERQKQSYERIEKPKYCNWCEIIHPSLQFSSDRTNTDGLQSKCKMAFQKERLEKLNTVEGFIKKNMNNYHKIATKQNMQFTITQKDIGEIYKNQNGLCALTNKKMTYKLPDKTKEENYDEYKSNLYVDRIDLSKGYIKDNVNLICNIANKIKSHLSNDELILISEAITINNDNDMTINNIISLLDNITDKQFGSNSIQEKFINSLDRYITNYYDGLKKRKNAQLLITKKDIKNLYIEQNGKCKLSGKKMTHVNCTDLNNEIAKWNIIIDLIDKTKPITKDNIQLICHIIYIIKHDIANNEFIVFCNDISKTNQKRINSIILNLRVS